MLKQNQPFLHLETFISTEKSGFACNPCHLHSLYLRYGPGAHPSTSP